MKNETTTTATTLPTPFSGRWFLERGWIYGLPVLVVSGLILTLANERLHQNATAPKRPSGSGPALGLFSSEGGGEEAKIELSEKERAEGFGAAHWGMSAAEVRKAMGGPLAYRQSYLLGQQVWLSYNYNHAGQLYEVAAVYPSLPESSRGKYSSLLQQQIHPSLTNQYGEPKTIQEFNDKGVGTQRLLWVGNNSRIETYLDLEEDSENLRIVFRSKSIHEAIQQQKENADEAHRKKKSKVFAE